MIKEDYVSYEVAKLLKEKGFDESVNKFYEIFTGKPSLVRSEYCRNSFTISYAAPTHQMTLKWLREVHNWYIDIRFNRHYQCYIPIVYNMSGTLESIANLEERPKSYEEATEAALLYVLKNLI